MTVDTKRLRRIGYAVQVELNNDSGLMIKRAATEIETLRAALSAYVKFADGHGEIIFAAGGMAAIDRMNAATSLARAALAQDKP